MIYLTKGSGSNGVNTVYFVDPTGTACPNGMGVPSSSASLPTTPLSCEVSNLQTDGLPNNMCILAGFPSTPNKRATVTAFPFGIWFANPNIVYVADDGDGDAGGTDLYSHAAAQTTAGLQKWVFDRSTSSRSVAYTLQTGLGLGTAYTVTGLPTGTNAATGLPWSPATDGLRNITGRVNADGTVTIWAITSAVTGNEDTGADLNQLVSVTNTPANLDPGIAAGESFTTVRSAGFGEVVRTADDAREIAVKRMDADRLTADQDASATRVADATARSEADARARANAETAAADAGRQSAKATQDAADALAKQQAAQADSDRNLAAAAAAVRPTADAQQAQRDAEAESDRSKAAAARSDAQLRQAMVDRDKLRAQPLIQFNAILSTRDTARGLVANLSDVLFDIGKYTLRPAAREKLSKISGIVLAYPDLRLAIEGNTDSAGSEAMNRDLSERRAGAVMDYLAKENIPAGSMTSQGFRKTQPAPINDTAAGRQQNRHVEMAVWGDGTGTMIGPVSETLPMSIRPRSNNGALDRLGPSDDGPSLRPSSILKINSCRILRNLMLVRI